MPDLMTNASRVSAGVLTLLTCLTSLALCAAPAGDVSARLRNDPTMVPFYTGRILPTPQQATYSTQFFSLSRTGIWLGDGLKESDLRVTILRDRIAQYDGSSAFVTAVNGDFDTILCLGNGPAAEGIAAPDKSEGYIIKPMRIDGKNVIVLKGHDARGLLWAVSSLKQLITWQDGRCVVQTAEVTDYPSIANRGFVNGAMRTKTTPVVADWPRLGFATPLKEFIVDFKMNKVSFSGSLLADRRVVAHTWKSDLPKIVTEELRKTGDFLTPLGIEWYVGLHNLSWTTDDLQLRSKDEEDFQAVFKKACAVMDAGGSFCLMYDDLRFPMSPEDVKNFGTAREADIYFINKLHAALKAKHPGKPVKLLFCPPFYWGPRAGHTYPESREE